MAHGSTFKTVKLVSSYGIDRASELAAALRAALSASPRLSIDLSAASDMDVSAIQLLYAAKKSCVAKGGDCVLAGDVSAELCERLLAGAVIKAKVRDGQELALALSSFMAIGADNDR